MAGNGSDDRGDRNRCSYKGVGSVGTLYDRECDRKKFARKSDQFREPMPDRVGPVATEDAPADGTGVTMMTGNYLEISGPRIPGVFLELAEEARTIVFVDG